MMIKNLIKNIINKFNFQLVKNHLGFKIEWVPDIHKENKIDLLEILIINELKNGWNGLIQIGANDGIHADPVRNIILKYKLKSLLVEPLPHIYSKLLNNYKNIPFINFENSAIIIDNKNLEKYISFFELIDEINKTNLSGFSSTKINKVKSIQKTIPGSKIKEHRVSCLSVKELLKKYKINEASVLIIDAEGLDIQLCKEFLKLSNPPKIIYFEILDQKKFEIDEVIKILINKGYKISGNISDIIAHKF